MNMKDVRESKVKVEGFFTKAVTWWKFFWNAEKEVEAKVEELRAEVSLELGRSREVNKDPAGEPNVVEL